MTDHVTLQAPAKLNLALAVGPVADRGLHPICSWMVTVDLCDDLHLTRLDAGSLSRYAIIWHRDAPRRSDIDWSITRDLTAQAHLALQRELGQDLPIQLRVEKRIPVGGGLGGGSSDAAATLRAINELFGLGLTIDELARIGAGIGSDVPYLVHGGSAVVQGFGERIERHAAAPEFHAVLVFPEFPCETPRVYGIFDELTGATDHVLRSEAVLALVGGESATSPPPPPPEGLFNDLAPAAVKSAPRLDGCLERCSTLAERPAHVSGSGSTLFVICDNELHAEALAADIRRQLDLTALAVKTHLPDPAFSIDSG